MEQIGYSIIDADGNELKAFGNIKGQLQGIPDVLVLPNGDHVHCAVAGDTFEDYRFVERWLDDNAPSPWHASTGSTIAFDGTRTVVTVTYETTASLVPSVITPRQARLALLGAGLLEPVQAAIDAAGGAAKITWEYATEISRTDALIETLGKNLGLTDAAIDFLFRQAAGIK